MMDQQPTTPQTDPEILSRIARRALTLAVRMIDEANHREDEEPGDPKTGGHPAACASSVHMLAALRLSVASPFDTFAVKPHASPVDHALNFLMGAFRHPGTRRWMSLEDSQAVMGRLRQYPFGGQPVFQSYHAESDPDSHGYFPSGSVGIPPVVSLYTALAYRYAQDHGHEVPPAHHWSLMGDSEFREGSLLEAMPEAAERDLPHVTWLVDYNRQNLDGVRPTDARYLGHSDAERMVRTAEANGWEALQLIHGSRRLAFFRKKGGALLREVLERGLPDDEFQALLARREGALTRERLLGREPKLEPLLDLLDDEKLQALFEDLGGHDMAVLQQAFTQARRSSRPTFIVVHTIKGWGMSSWAQPGNHSTLLPRDEVVELLRQEGIDPEKESPYQRFPEESPEGEFLAARGAAFREGVEAQWALKDRNREKIQRALDACGPLPDTLGIDLKFTPMAHSQYVVGQAVGKLVRLGLSTHVEGTRVAEAEKPLVAAADLIVTMAPDVGTSTSINPAMDGKVYGPPPEENFEESLNLRDRKRPALSPRQEITTRHVRFEIAEANCMSAAGAFGKLGDALGIPYLPVMTIYDFFIKRAFDQLYYNLYWGSRFVVVGTPSGVSLSPEGAQHSWKTDIQMPNGITWEPAYGAEMDWVLADTLKRHTNGDDAHRSGIIVRAVTRGIEQKQQLARLKTQRRFEGLSDAEILDRTRADAVAGGYWLVDWRGHEGYEPGDNVVHLVAMGALVPEALAASDRLREAGLFANVLVATSPDLLVGNLAHADGYRHLRETLGVDGTLHVTNKRANGHVTYEVSGRADLIEVAAGRVPVVTVLDGEPGSLDNLGSIVGTRQITLAVRKSSKCGRPSDVYALHGLDPESISRAARQALAESALEQVLISPALLKSLSEEPLDQPPAEWEEAWGEEGHR